MPSKKITPEEAIKLARESPPIDLVPIVEERPTKKNKRQFIITKSSEATKFDHPVKSADVYIKTLNIEQQNSVEEVHTESIQHHSDREQTPSHQLFDA
jgi:hypothetical protein